VFPEENLCSSGNDCLKEAKEMETGLITGLGMAAFWDLRFRTIPNWLIVSMSLIAFAYHYDTAGLIGLSQASLGFITGIFLLLLPFAMGGVGGGDVKLLATIGAFVGCMNVLIVFLAATVIGGLISLVVALCRGALGRTLRGVKERVLYIMLNQRIPHEQENTFTKEPISIPYAVPLGLGVLVMLGMGG